MLVSFAAALVPTFRIEWSVIVFSPALAASAALDDARGIAGAPLPSQNSLYSEGRY
jgi:hypothetical protein